MCRRRVIGNCKLALKNAEKALRLQFNDRIIWTYDTKILEKLFAQLNSYLGHFKYAKTYRIISHIFNSFSFLHEYFELTGTQKKVVRKYELAKTIRFFRQQVSYYSKRYANTLLLFQIGCYYETYGRGAKKMHSVLNYQLKRKWRGFAVACGFHRKYLGKVVKVLEENGISYMILKQTGKYLSNTRERIPVKRVEFKIN